MHSCPLSCEKREGRVPRPKDDFSRDFPPPIPSVSFFLSVLWNSKSARAPLKPARDRFFDEQEPARHRGAPLESRDTYRFFSNHLRRPELRGRAQRAERERESGRRHAGASLLGWLATATWSERDRSLAYAVKRMRRAGSHSPDERCCLDDGRGARARSSQPAVLEGALRRRSLASALLLALMVAVAEAWRRWRLRAADHLRKSPLRRAATAASRDKDLALELRSRARARARVPKEEKKKAPHSRFFPQDTPPTRATHTRAGGAARLWSSIDCGPLRGAASRLDGRRCDKKEKKTARFAKKPATVEATAATRNGYC